MNTEDFRESAKKLIDYICDYSNDVGKYPLVADVAPGYLRPQLPQGPPEHSETFDEVLADVDKLIMPGITHWQHPHFFAYFPTGTSYPSHLAEMLSNMFACVGFSWASCPAYTELELVMCDWLVDVLDLPDFFKHTSKQGGGVIEGSTTESTLLAIVAARERAVEAQMEKDKQKAGTKKKWKKEDELTKQSYFPKLLIYISEMIHSSTVNCAKVSGLEFRVLPVDKNYQLRGETLSNAIKEDKAKGRIPFFLGAILGSTSICSYDNFAELGPICRENGIWLHVDGAYAGSMLICPEMRWIAEGFEHLDSFCFSPNKWMLMHIDITLMWVRSRSDFVKSHAVEPKYLQHSNNDAEDLRHWGLPLARRFRALKIWLVLRCYGIEKLRENIRNHVELAKYFETLVVNDGRFDIITPVTSGLCCFRLKGGPETNDITETLLENINNSKKIYMVSSDIKEDPHKIIFIRFCVCHNDAVKSHIDYAWSIILEHTNALQRSLQTNTSHIKTENSDARNSIHFDKDFARQAKELLSTSPDAVNNNTASSGSEFEDQIQMHEEGIMEFPDIKITL